MSITLGFYTRKGTVKAIRITKANIAELQKMDGDGCTVVAEIGDWYVEEPSGGQIYNDESFHDLFKRAK